LSEVTIVLTLFMFRHRFHF